MLTSRQIFSLGIKGGAWLSLLAFLVLFICIFRSGPATRPEAFFLAPVDEASDGVNSSKKTILSLDLAGTTGEAHHHSIRLETDMARALLASPRIGLLMLTNWSTAEIDSAKIVFSEKATQKVTAKYVVKKGTLIQENRKLEFVRTEQSLVPSGSDSQNVTIDIVSSGAPNLAIAGRFTEERPLSKWLWMREKAKDGAPGFASASGWFDPEKQSRKYSRGQLLAYMWGFGTDGVRVIYSLLLVAVAVSVGGIVALTNGFSPIRTTLGAVCLFAGSGLIYMTIVPPFQAADEPDHFLTYTRLNNQPLLANDALVLANDGHFERIKFRTDEKFCAADFYSPMSGPWARHIDPNDPDRSPIAKRVWSYASKLVHSSHAGVAILALRLMNILFVSGCIAISLGLAAWSMPSKGESIFIVAPVLLTPCISYFSTVFSNYPFLIGGYIFQTVALGLIWQQSASGRLAGRALTTAGFLAGSGIVLAVTASDNGIFSLAFWALLIPLLHFLKGLHGSGQGDEGTIPAAFHIAFASPFLLVYLAKILHGPNYLILPEILVWSFNNKLHLPFQQWFSLAALVFVVFPAWCFLASLILGRLGVLCRDSSLLHYGKGIMAALLLFGAGVSLLHWVFPIHEYVQAHSGGSLISTVCGFLYNYLEGFGPGPTNWLVVESFWGSFGWLDTPLPKALIDVLRFFCAVGLFALLYLSLATKQPKGLGLFFCTVSALMLFAVSLVAGYWSFHFTVNSRYLVGLYLLTLIVAYEGIRRLLRHAFVGMPPLDLVPSVVCILCMAVQCTAWIAILDRYFC